MKTILKQDSNSRQRQDIVPVSNLKARKIETLLSLPIHLGHYQFAAAAVAPLSIHCRCCPSCCLSCCRSCCRSAIAPAVAPDVAPLSLRCRCCCSCCRYCCDYTVTPVVALLSLRYRSVISPLSLRCFSADAAVTPAVSPLSPLLLLLLLLLLTLVLFTFVASRGRIRVTVAIRDCQAHVSSCL